MTRRPTSLERRRKDVLSAYARGESTTSIMERICKKYDIRPNSFWVDWAKIRPDRGGSNQQAEDAT